MNKDTEIYGVDISKDVFDVFSIKTGHTQFKNDERGFTAFFHLAL